MLKTVKKRQKRIRTHIFILKGWIWVSLDLKEQQIIYKGCLNSKESFETARRCPIMQNITLLNITTEIQNLDVNTVLVKIIGQSF